MIIFLVNLMVLVLEIMVLVMALVILIIVKDGYLACNLVMVGVSCTSSSHGRTNFREGEESGNLTIFTLANTRKIFFTSIKFRESLD